MTEKDYLWVFDSAALGSGGNGFFSLEYRLSPSILQVRPEELVGSRLWLVLKESSDYYLYAFLAPAALEVYREGSYKGDLLLHSEPFGSVRFLPRSESKDSWRLTQTSRFDGKIRECDAAEREEFGSVLKRNHRVSFADPSSAFIESIPATKFKDLERGAPDQLALVLRTVAFGDVSSARSFPATVSALGGIALAILKSKVRDYEEKKAFEIVSALDPFGNSEERLPKTSATISAAVAELPPQVDSLLEKLDPDDIAPRSFVARAEYSSLDWIEKTDEAETSHENILKDVASRFKEKQFEIYKSQSFDLYVKGKGPPLLWEVKSATAANTVSQIEKGIMQILRYSIALSDNGSGDVRPLLLLQRAASYAVLEYSTKLAQKAGVELWFYDREKPWPNRVFNLDQDNFPGL